MIMSKMNLSTSAVATALTVIALSSQPAMCAVTVGQQVAANRQVSIDRIDHGAWDTLVKKHVNAKGNVDYTGWKRSAADVRALNKYLEALSTANPKLRASKSAKLAFWCNAYNALTIKGILREYPTTSIRNHTARFFGYNIWKDLLLVVGGKTYSLEAIEHETLRKMGEPRIHFAIVCASHSCPRLLNEAYTADKIEKQLNDNAKDFFSNRENFRHSDEAFYLSSILKWFAEDFGSSKAAQLRTISPYLPDAVSRQAAHAGTGSISYLDYDWSLNDQKTKR